MKKIKYEEIMNWTGPRKSNPYPGLPYFSKSRNPLIEKKFAYVSTFKSKKVIAFDPKNGSTRWEFNLGVYGGSPLVTDDKFVFAGTNRGVICISKTTGKLKWKYEPYSHEEESFYSEPIQNNGYIFLLDREGNLHKLNASSGKVKYCIQLAKEKKDSFSAKAALKAGKIYAISNRGYLVCVEIDSGDIVWTASLKEGSIHALALSGNSLIVQGETSIFEIDLQSKKVKSFKFKGIIDIWVKDGIFYVLDKKSNDKLSAILFEYKNKKKKLFEFSGNISAFTHFENENSFSLVGQDGIIFCNKGTKILVQGLFSGRPYISKNRIVAIDLIYEVICFKNPIDPKVSKKLSAM